MDLTINLGKLPPATRASVISGMQYEDKAKHDLQVLEQLKLKQYLDRVLVPGANNDLGRAQMVMTQGQRNMAMRIYGDKCFCDPDFAKFLRKQHPEFRLKDVGTRIQSGYTGHGRRQKAECRKGKAAGVLALLLLLLSLLLPVKADFYPATDFIGTNVMNRTNLADLQGYIGAGLPAQPPSAALTNLSTYNGAGLTNLSPNAISGTTYTNGALVWLNATNGALLVSNTVTHAWLLQDTNLNVINSSAISAATLTASNGTTGTLTIGTNATHGFTLKFSGGILTNSATY